MRISVVIPVYNERNSIIELCRRLIDVLDRIDPTSEIIFIDDGSIDGTFDSLRNVKDKNPGIKIIKLDRNYGKSQALLAGLNEARGECIIIMDGDLQDVPEEIPKLLEKLNAGYDMVVGWRKIRQDNYSKILTSNIFNFFMRMISGIKLHDFNSGLKVVRSSVIHGIKDNRILHRFMPVIVSWNGYSVSEVVVNHNPRVHGRSRYGITRIPEAAGEFTGLLLLMKYPEKLLKRLSVVFVVILILVYGFTFYIFYKYIKYLSPVVSPIFVLVAMFIILSIQIIFYLFFIKILVTVTQTEKNYKIEYII